MKIESVRFENFRSIAHAEFDAAGFDVSAGQNKHVKTKPLQALEWFHPAIMPGLAPAAAAGEVN